MSSMCRALGSTSNIKECGGWGRGGEEEETSLFGSGFSTPEAVGRRTVSSKPFLVHRKTLLKKRREERKALALLELESCSLPMSQRLGMKGDPGNGYSTQEEHSHP